MLIIFEFIITVCPVRDKMGLSKKNLVVLSLKETVRYHSGGSMKLNACNLLLSHMVYL